MPVSYSMISIGYASMILCLLVSQELVFHDHYWVTNIIKGIHVTGWWTIFICDVFIITGNVWINTLSTWYLTRIRWYKCTYGNIKGSPCFACTTQRCTSFNHIYQTKRGTYMYVGNGMFREHFGWCTYSCCVDLLIKRRHFCRQHFYHSN